MAGKPQFKIAEQCERCPREILTNLTADEAVARAKAASQPPPQKALEVRVEGTVVVSYGKLCDDCEGICAAALESLKPQTKKSARRSKAEKPPQETGAPTPRAVGSADSGRRAASAGA